MKRVKCNKIRTVTTVVNCDEQLQKTYDLTQFDIKNLNSSEVLTTIKIKLALAKYMAMINTLELTQPLMEIFRNKTDTRQIAAVVLATLGFIHNRFNSLVTNFTNKMEFVVTETNDLSIPGEPILFAENENGVFLCSIDRPSIVKMLSRNFDTDSHIEYGAKENNNIKIAKTLGAIKPQKRGSGGGGGGGDGGRGGGSGGNYDDYVYDFNLNETLVTQYLTLLLIAEHAYLHYYIFKNYGSFDYAKSLLDHSLFMNKLRSTMDTRSRNLLLSQFQFTIEDFDKINTNSIVAGFNILPINKFD
jgi:hypothetical protein